MTDVTDLGEIVVTGKRKKAGDLPRIPEMQTLDPETGEVTGGGGGGRPMTQAQADAENQRQKDCAAEQAKGKIDEKTNKNSKEYFSHVFDRAGDTAVHDPQGGDGASLTRGDFNDARAEFGISLSSLLGLVHNHPRDVYCNNADNYTQNLQRAANQYPSDADWAYAEELVGQGVPADTFTLYIVGCDGDLRAFPFNERDTFRAERAKANPTPHPELEPACE